MGLLSTLLLVVTVWELDRQAVRVPRWLAFATGATCLVLLLEVGARLRPDGVPTPWSAGTVALGAVAGAGLVLLLSLGRTRAAVSGLAAFSVVAGGAVNPLYHGLVDVQETPVGSAIARLQGDGDGMWVSTAGIVSNAVLVASGVPTFSAAFSYPVFSAWTELDPERRYRSVYNRYAHVDFRFDVQGAPLQNPQADVVVAGFEPCGDFAQTRVAHVLTEAPAPPGCLRLADQVAMPGRTFYLYDVVRPG
jgi:hypothetical protein